MLRNRCRHVLSSRLTSLQLVQISSKIVGIRRCAFGLESVAKHCPPSRNAGRPFGQKSTLSDLVGFLRFIQLGSQASNGVIEWLQPCKHRCELVLHLALELGTCLFVNLVCQCKMPVKSPSFHSVWKAGHHQSYYSLLACGRCRNAGSLVVCVLEYSLELLLVLPRVA